MKHKFVILILVTFNLSAFCQNDGISEIRRLYKETQENKNTYTRLSQEDFENSSEGGEITAYKSSDEIRLIEAVYYGHMGKSKSEYYFKDNKVYFAYEFAEESNKILKWATEMLEMAE